MVKRLKIKEKEKRQKLKEAKAGENKKPSKAEVAENLKKLTKGGKATILKVRGLCYFISHTAHICLHSCTFVSLLFSTLYGFLDFQKKKVSCLTVIMVMNCSLSSACGF